MVDLERLELPTCRFHVPPLFQLSYRSTVIEVGIGVEGIEPTSYVVLCRWNDLLFPAELHPVLLGVRMKRESPHETIPCVPN